MNQTAESQSMDFNVPYPPESQIQIPPELPRILKEYVKEILREQPDDLLLWSAKYFRRLADRAKVQRTTETSIFGPKHGGLSLAVMQLMYGEFKDKQQISLTELREFWEQQQLCPAVLEQFLTLARVDIPLDDIEWMKILALGTAGVSVDLKETLKNICIVCTAEVGQAKAPFRLFRRVYQFLADVSNEVPTKIEEMIKHFEDAATRQNGFLDYDDIENTYF